MALTSEIVDQFTDAALGVQWAASYGDVGADPVNARARVGTSHTAGVPNYGGLFTGYSHTLDSFAVRVTPQPLSGGTVDVYTTLAIENPVTEGQRLSITYDLVTGMVRFSSETDYWDDTADATQMAWSTSIQWWKIALVGANVVFSTSSDGWLWTTRRTVAAPAWIAATVGTHAVLLAASRASGTASDAYFSYANQNEGTPLPRLVEQSSGGSSANATSVTIPTTQDVGFRLVHVAIDGGAVPSTTSTGWTLWSAVQDATANVTGALLYATAATAAANLVVSFQTSGGAATSEQASWTYQRITGWGQAATPTFASGSSASSNSPAATTSGGGSNYLAFTFRAGDAQVIPTAAPSGYSGLVNAAGLTTASASASSAWRKFSSTVNATEDPGAFTVASEQWVAHTVLIASSTSTAGVADRPVSAAAGGTSGEQPLQRHYLTSVPAAVSPDPGVTATLGWSTVNPSLPHAALYGRPAGELLVASVTEAFAEAGFVHLVTQHVSAPLAAGVFGGPLSVTVFRASDLPAATNLLRPRLRVWVVKPDGTERGTSVAGAANGLTFEVTPGAIQINAPLTPMLVSAGDRVVLELGFVAQNTITDPVTGSLYFGGDGGSDAVAGSTDLLGSRAWVDLPTASLLSAPPDVTVSSGAPGAVSAVGTPQALTYLDLAGPGVVLASGGTETVEAAGSGVENVTVLDRRWQYPGLGTFPGEGTFPDDAGSGVTAVSVFGPGQVLVSETILTDRAGAALVGGGSEVAFGDAVLVDRPGSLAASGAAEVLAVGVVRSDAAGSLAVAGGVDVAAVDVPVSAGVAGFVSAAAPTGETVDAAGRVTLTDTPTALLAASVAASTVIDTVVYDGIYLFPSPDLEPNPELRPGWQGTYPQPVAVGGPEALIRDLFPADPSVGAVLLAGADNVTVLVESQPTVFAVDPGAGAAFLGGGAEVLTLGRVLADVPGAVAGSGPAELVAVDTTVTDTTTAPALAAAPQPIVVLDVIHADQPSAVQPANLPTYRLGDIALADYPVAAFAGGGTDRLVELVPLTGWPPLVSGPFPRPLVIVEGPFVAALVDISS